MLAMNRVVLIPTMEVFDLSVQLSFDVRHSLADCLYLAAAKHWKTELITSDRTLFQRGAKAKTRVVLLDGRDAAHG
jgi:predicted nucleic acid-binding protein